LKEIEKKEGKEGDEPEIEDKPVEEEDEGEAKEGDEEKPKALLRPLIPSQKKRRPHRKTHGKVSFQQLARMVGERWKSLPEDERKYYQELAQEDMKRQKLAMEEYYAKQNASKSKPSLSSSGGIGGGDSVKREEDTTESLGHSSYNEV
jgi:HMG (high mobility group) box